MKFGFVTLYVQNLDRALGFYHGLLGLPVLQRHPAGAGELAFLGLTGQPSIELLYAPGTPPPTPNGFSVGIEVPSLDEATALLAQNGFPVVRGPLQPAPHTRFSFVRDPDGFEVELIEYLR